MILEALCIIGATLGAVAVGHSLTPPSPKAPPRMVRLPNRPKARPESCAWVDANRLQGVTDNEDGSCCVVGSTCDAEWVLENVTADEVAEILGWRC